MSSFKMTFSHSAFAIDVTCIGLVLLNILLNKVVKLYNIILFMFNQLLVVNHYLSYLF